MTPFDPYHKWLGIPETARPISKYRLLGIDDFESDRDVISAAAERQTIYLRTLQAGEHEVLVAQLLNEVSQARVTLLNVDEKVAYDEGLRKQQTPEPVPEPAAAPIPMKQTPDPSPTPVVVRGTVTQEFPVSIVQPARRPRRRAQNKILKRPVLIGVSVVGVIGVLALLINLMSSGDADPVASNVPPVVTSPLTPSSQPEPRPTTPPQQTQPTASNETLPAKVAVAPFDADQAKAHQQAWSKYLGVPVEYTNSIGMKFMLIPPGEFMMGSPKSEAGRDPGRETLHRVTLTRPFEMGMHEVTQEQYEQVMGKNPSKRDGAHHPAEAMAWSDAIEYCRKLSNLPKEKATGRVYRLPTEAEWEYVCRAGTTTAYSFGDDASKLGEYAWYIANSGKISHPIGEKNPNPWGVFGMHGNVFEWCHDWFGAYPSGSVVNPMGPTTGKSKLNRGGSVNNTSEVSRSAERGGFSPNGGHGVLGFRVVLEISVRTPPDKITAETNTLPASLQEGLVAYYPFNGNANDESGNGHHGEVQGAALTADRHGVPVSAYGFDGTKDMINLGDQWGDFGTDPFTIALWVYRKTTSNCDAFVSKGKYGKSAQWNLVTANPTDNGMTPRNQIRFHLTSTGSNGNTIHSTSQVGTKTWHHVVIQRNTRGLNMFIDGYLDASLTCSPLNADSSVPVRCGFVDTWQPNEYRMNGDIDDVRIYNRALSAAEVKSLYDYESTPPVPPTAPAIESITNTIGMTLNKIPAGYLLEHIP
jgi:formylglycine-generating enzyme required for sulfatase activity